MYIYIYISTQYTHVINILYRYIVTFPRTYPFSSCHPFTMPPNHLLSSVIIHIYIFICIYIYTLIIDMSKLVVLWVQELDEHRQQT